MDNMWNQFTTPGGRGWKHNCSLRIMFQQGDMFDENTNIIKKSAENPFGNMVNMRILKTKICRPDRKTGYYTLCYTSGVDAIGDTIDCGLLYGLIKQSGAWFYLVDSETGEIRSDVKINGKAKLREYYKENIEEYEKLQEKINSMISEE